MSSRVVSIGRLYVTYITGGKSHFLCELVKYREQLFEKPFDRIILCQHENLSYRNNSTFETIKTSFPTAELVSGLPNISKLGLDHSNANSALLLVDDLQSQFLNSAEMELKHHNTYLSWARIRRTLSHSGTRSKVLRQFINHCCILLNNLTYFVFLVT